MRASDGDREKIVSRLRDAHIEGRLSADEFNDRLSAAYDAQTYGELEPLIRDIPVMRVAQQQAPAVAKPEPVREVVPRSGKADRTMRVMWTVWACVASLNLVIWVLASVSNVEVIYFWPAWVAGPWGAVLLSIDLIRRSGRKEP